MPFLLRAVLAGALLLAAALCLFGFMATFEPPGWPQLRLGYAAAGGACVLGAALLLRRRKVA